ncbi:MAG: hypothetical protein LBF85_00700 [Tannerella sp.]|jgi:hypothetical protein|nr:hypothetical protein [Tannerella sp.]
MKKVFFLAIAVCTVFAVGAQEKRYAVESGIVKNKSTMMGQDIVTVQYFADYGAKESSETIMKMQGQEFLTFTMVKDGYAYMANLTAKQGNKVKLSDMGDFRNINFLALTDDVKQKYKIEEKGSGKVLDRECKKYDLTYTAQGQSYKATVWIWKGLALKAEMDMMGNTVTVEATEITETKDIPESRFELPEGINFTEVNPNMFQ